MEKTRTERILENNFKILKDSMSDEEKKTAIVFLKAWEIEEKRRGFGFGTKTVIDYLDDYKEAGKIYELQLELINKNVEIKNLEKDKAKLIEKLKNQT